MRLVTPAERSRLAFGASSLGSSPPLLSQEEIADAAFFRELALMVGSDKRASDLMRHSTIGAPLRFLQSRVRFSLTRLLPDGSPTEAPPDAPIWSKLRQEIAAALALSNIKLSPPLWMAEGVLVRLAGTFVSSSVVQAILQSPSLGPLFDNLLRQTEVALPSVMAWNNVDGWQLAPPSTPALAALKDFFAAQLTQAGLLAPLSQLTARPLFSPPPTSSSLVTSNTPAPFVIASTSFAPPSPPPVTAFVSPQSAKPQVRFSTPSFTQPPSSSPPPPKNLPGDDVAGEGWSSQTAPIEEASLPRAEDMLMDGRGRPVGPQYDPAAVEARLQREAQVREQQAIAANQQAASAAAAASSSSLLLPLGIAAAGVAVILLLKR